MAKPTPLSGFPEWLPAERLVEQVVLDHVRASFERFGFGSIETRSVEPLEQLLSKGETDKEIYVLRRLQADDSESDKAVGLHYDLTVPFARYVAQNQGRLVFPFKRYQIQKAWRGERPQEGRYREFLQADFDVVGNGGLPVEFDSEIPRILHALLDGLPLPPVVLRMNNRKILQGFYEGLGIEAVEGVLRTVDKLEKIGAAGVLAALVGEQGLDPAVAQKCLDIGAIQTEDASFADRVRALGVRSDLLDLGLQELTSVMDSLADLPRGFAVVDLRIARGFDYYTGTVYEGVMEGFEKLGTVCAGGRYDDLVAGAGAKQRMPGVGMTVGVTRMLAPLLSRGLLAPTRPTPTCVLVAMPSEERAGIAAATATALRARGIPTEVFHEAARYGKQIKYANRKGVPFVWFPPEGEGEDAVHEVRDIRSSDQVPADPATWMPPEDDRRIGIVRTEG